mgnify:CR=1 FL=1
MATSSMHCVDLESSGSTFDFNESADVYNDEEFEGQSDAEHVFIEEQSSGKINILSPAGGRAGGLAGWRTQYYPVLSLL